MRLVELNWNPSDRQLRQFGLISLVALPALAWIWSGGNLTATWMLAAVGAILAGLGLLYPRSLKPVFVGLSVLAIPISLVVGEVAMLLIYFGMFLPMAMLFRLIKRDGLNRRFLRQADTYWQPKKQPDTPAGYFRQW